MLQRLIDQSVAGFEADMRNILESLTSKHKPEAYVPPDAMLSRLLEGADSEHQRLEFDASPKAMQTFRMAAGFSVAMPPIHDPHRYPLAFMGIYKGLPVYEDESLPVGAFEVRDVYGDVIASAQLE